MVLSKLYEPIAHTRGPRIMELKLVEKKKDSIKVEFQDADETLIYPLIHELLQDKTVEDARYVTGHPQLDKAVLVVKVKEGKPQAALKKAVKALANQYLEARQLIEKQLG
jgi:DNA-directed RNA polymerase subunit L